MAARAGKSEKPGIRQQILRFLKTRGRAQIREVAKHMRITHEGARKQLVLLEEDGWVSRNAGVTLSGLAASGPAASSPASSRNRSSGRGRPKDFYSVTLSGDEQLPKAYDQLSIAILDALKDESGGKAARRLLSALAENQVEAWAPRLKGKDLQGKLEALRGLYAESDPFASVEMRDGEWVLIERNCPFLSVAMKHPALCSLSVSTLEMLLGCAVVREERFQSGHGRCVFRLKLGSAPKKDFRFESEASA